MTRFVTVRFVFIYLVELWRRSRMGPYFGMCASHRQVFGYKECTANDDSAPCGVQCLESKRYLD